MQAKYINKSLSALGNVIKALADKAVSEGLGLGKAVSEGLGLGKAVSEGLGLGKAVSG